MAKINRVRLYVIRNGIPTTLEEIAQDIDMVLRKSLIGGLASGLLDSFKVGPIITFLPI